MKAMILSAGMGTRLKPLTDNIPKALVKINGIPLIEHVIIKLKKFSVTEIIINIHHFADQVINFVQSKNNFNIRIEFSKEEVLLDTGGGLKKAAWFFDDDQAFILHNVDVLSDIDLSKMLEHHTGKKALATLAARDRKTSRYFLFDEQYYLCGWKSVKSGETNIVKNSTGKLIPLSFMGIHILSPQIFTKLPDKNIFSIVNTYLDWAAKSEIICGFRADEYRWLDLGRQENIKKAEEYFNL